MFLNKVKKVFNQVLSSLTLLLLIFYQSYIPLAFAQEVSQNATDSSLQQSEQVSDPSPTPLSSPEVSPTPDSDSTTISQPSPSAQITPEQSSTSTPDNNPTPTPSDTLVGSPNAPPDEGVLNGSLSVSLVHNLSSKSTTKLDLDSSNQTSSASLTTDKQDYSPTDTVIISGSNLQPQTSYTLVITSNDPPTVHFETQVTADKKGEFVYSYQLDGTYRANYQVELLESGTSVTTTTFTDTATITAASGGSAISADTTSAAGGSNTSTTLGAVTIAEGANGDFQFTASTAVTFILNAPTGFAFDTTSSSNVTFTASRDISSASVTNFTTTALTVTVTPTTGNVTNELDTLTIGSVTPLKVKPTTGTAGTTGNITNSGTMAITGVTQGSTNFGTLTEVAGAVNAGTSTVSASPTSVPANGTTTSTITVTLKDQFSNPVSGKNVTLATNGGTSATGITITQPSSVTNASGQTTGTIKATGSGIAVVAATDTTDSNLIITQTATVTFTDATAPNDPTNVVSSDHTTSVASNDNTITMTWTAATDNAGGSGVDGYAYVFNNTAGSVCDQGKDLEETITTVTSGNLADGSWYFHICTVDNAGNWTSTVNVGPFPIDTTAPTTTDSGIDTNWHNSDVSVTLTCNDGSGVGCGNTYHTTNGSTPTTGSSTTNPFTLTANGNYTIKYFSVDTLSNTESVKTATNTVKIDKTNPTDPTDVHSTSHTALASTDTTIDMAWTVAGSAPGATDTLSGVDGYSYSFTNGATDVPDTVKDAEENATSTTSSVLADGTWYFHLRTRDNAGNWTSTVHGGPFVVDTTAPVLQSFTSSTSNGTYGPGSSINVTANYNEALAGGSTITVLLNTGASVTLNTVSGSTLTGSYVVGATGSGQNTSDLTISSISSQNALDSAGNAKTNTTMPGTNIATGSDILVDTTAPTGSITINNNDTYTTTTAVNLNFSSVSADVTTMELRNGTVGAFQSPIAFENPHAFVLTNTQGTRSVSVRFTDGAGNISTGVISDSIIFDSVAPTATDSGIDTNWHNSDVIVTLNCLDATSGCATTYHTTDGSTPTTGSSATNPFTLTSNGNYTIKYFSKDNAGNAESIKTATNTVKIDKTNPTDPTSVISSSHTTSVWANDNTIDISWSGASDALSGVAGYSYLFDTSAATVPDTTSEGAGTSTTSSTLADGNSHYFHLRTLDNAGNWTSTVHMGPFYIETVASSTPVATLAAGDYTTDQITTFAAGSDTGGSGFANIYYTIDGTTPSNINGTLYTGAPITIDHSLTLKAVSYDNAGNVSSVMTEVYGIAPVISAESTSAPTDTSLTVTWTTDDPATSRVIYDTISHPVLGSAPNYGYSSSTVEDSTKVTSHSVIVSGLSASTTYFYRSVSHGSPETVGSEQSTATAAVAGVSTSTSQATSQAGAPSCDDLAPASAPILLSATPSGANQVTLIWIPAADPVTNYVVSYGLTAGNPLYGNPNVGGKDTTSYTVSGLSGGATYYFRVRAGNGCNGSPYSNELSANPGGGLVIGPAAGFAPGVLGAATQKSGNVGLGEVQAEATSSPAENLNNTFSNPTEGNSNKGLIITIIVLTLGVLAGFIIFKRFV